ncbi:ferritin-like domain-containing protein [Limnoglobus roseus]|uniref:Ferritin-like domain-containing protein n=1 Tax=Limnoglobus roseus TaxID=2598579 RepID=A0A5C1AAD4_9BACT|nr:ferritin-like domain-containing protein [Limnoglobus roseus]QEL15690.1 hypothetical protein PX52LOC_02625 [Limnoglobus roseus]
MNRSGTIPAAVWSSAQWVAYFRENAAAHRPIPWESGTGATAAEVAEIAPSLRSWQLGETSDGRQLLVAAHRYAAAANDPDFVEAIRLFIGEEQRHGELLGRFLDLAGVGRAATTWGDSFFRAARHALPSMEVWATPVVMVEVHAMVYYNAIRRATPSPVLRAICEQILADEVPHIRFQCERLAVLHRRRLRVFRGLTTAFHEAFFLAITLAVWAGHRRALRAGGYNFGRYWKAVWGKMRAAWRAMDAKGYTWEAEAPAIRSRRRGVLEG